MSHQAKPWRVVGERWLFPRPYLYSLRWFQTALRTRPTRSGYGVPDSTHMTKKSPSSRTACPLFHSSYLEEVPLIYLAATTPEDHKGSSQAKNAPACFQGTRTRSETHVLLPSTAAIYSRRGASLCSPWHRHWLQSLVTVEEGLALHLPVEK